mgnify:CR=1 FL=1
MFSSLISISLQIFERAVANKIQLYDSRYVISYKSGIKKPTESKVRRPIAKTWRHEKIMHSIEPRMNPTTRD